MSSKDNMHKYNTPIAVIGMECFFPKSPGVKDYWRLIFRGEDGITEVPKTHWSPEDYFDVDPKKSDHVYCKRGGFLAPISFDPTEFGIPPSTLEATDSSQILALIAAKAALKDAGYGDGNKSFEKNRASVILGVTGTQELVIPLSSRLGYPIWQKALKESGIADEKAEEIVNRISEKYVSWQENSFPGLLGNVVAGRISNRLDLGGTNCVVDAACASSLSAVHLSILELVAGKSDIVVTGGVDTLNDIFMHMCFSKTQVLSPTGDAMPFSKNADGTVLGEGVGIIILKRLKEAINDNDKIYAVIKAIGSSSDGKSQSIYAPNIDGQINALRNAYDSACVDSTTVELIEAHGTGTRVGDEVEFQALKKFFVASNMSSKKKLNSIALGSVKSMIGHTKAAAGAAGLIKTIISLHNKILPPTLKAEEPDPNLNIQDSPFYLNTKARPWFSIPEHPRRAGVSSFGFGGSNFHAVLEEYPKEKKETAWDGSVEILAVSSKTLPDLKDDISELKNAIDKAASFKEIVQKAFESRLIFSSSDPFRLVMAIERAEFDSSDKIQILSRIEKLLNTLEENPEIEAISFDKIYYGGAVKPGKIAFVFPGQGSQYPEMGKDLVCVFPDAFNVLEKANAIFKGDKRLTDFIYPQPASDPKEKKRHEAELTNTDIAQPAIGSISLAMNKTLQYFGLFPDAACGHSFGELVALNSAGWIDDDTLLNLAVNRGALMAAAGRNTEQDSGTMTAVRAPLEEIDDLLKNSDTGVILANRNSPNQGVLSGATIAIEKAEKLCKEKGYKTIRLTVAAAFHSYLVKSAQKPFMEIVLSSDFTPTSVPVFSNTTGKAYPSAASEAKRILGEQILCPVDFVNDIKNLYDLGIRTFVEVGPKTVLSGLIKDICKDLKMSVISMDASGGKHSGILDLAKALSQIASLGYPVELARWEQGGGPLPGNKKPLMEVMISGANYRSEQKYEFKNEFKKKMADNGAINLKTDVEPMQMKEQKPSLENFLPENKNYSDNKKAVPDDKIKDDFGPYALKIVQEGLKSFQLMQKQTAEAHQKFLESQIEANKALQRMMESAQRLVAPILLNNRSLNLKINEVEVKQPPIQDNISIKAILLNTVSELTGYPVEMLGLDMDIESELGIDSIKRVEILSTLEEKIPGLPQVEPEMMGKLKTLRQIISYLSQNNSINNINGGVEENTKKAHASAAKEDVRAILLETVSELTGYPVEMLGLEMDIESDLGIDSIKRVEILSTLEEKIPGLPQVEPEMMGKLKTLDQIIKYISKPASKNDHSDKLSKKPLDGFLNNQKKHINSTNTQDQISGNTIRRHIISLVPKPFDSSLSISIPHGKKIYVLDDKSELSKALLSEFIQRRINAELISFNIDQNINDAAGLIIIPDREILKENAFGWSEKTASFLERTLMLSKHFGPSLKKSAMEGSAIFAAIYSLDGAFGFKGQGMLNPMVGALSGLIKTAAIEWEGVLCRCIDISPKWKQFNAVAKSVVVELLNNNPEAPVEIGLSNSEKFELKLTAKNLESKEIDIRKDEVVVITGGARGITAEAAYALALKCQPRLILIGRSPAPFSEPSWLYDLKEEKDIKKAILENEFKNRATSPVEVGNRYNQIINNREIISNLNLLKSTGAKVEYYSVDANNENDISRTIALVRSSYGPICAVIHGAGVVEDRLIEDKTREQFRRVFETKVKGLFNLLNAINHEELRYIVLFSSFAARFGNKGQADYAMANEALNKIAQKESLNRPGCKVISLNWGPWEGGMVSPELKKRFLKNNVDIIPLKSGADFLLSEMGERPGPPVEVIIGGTLPINEKSRIGNNDKPVLLKKDKSNNTPLSPAFHCEIDVEEYPVLCSHILNGSPVVPLALMTEWVGHSALHENPGLVFHGFDEMRVLNGIKLGSDKQKVSLLTSKIRKNSSFYEVDVEIRKSASNGQDVIYSRAKAILAEKLAPSPLFKAPAFFKSNGYSRSIHEIYDKILFHGFDLQGIKEVTNLCPDGVIARISTAPSPEKWIKHPLRSNWIGDPLVLDCAFQMASLWCFETKGFVSLPTYSASYRQYCGQFPKDYITVILEATYANDQKLKGDFTFLNKKNEVVAQINGFEAIMDPSLYKAFKPN